MTLDLLLEIGTEDLPARYVAPLSAALADGIANGLGRRGVAIGTVERFATPRRVAVLIHDVAERQSDQQQERAGPALTAAFKDGKPTPAALGFARSCGVEVEALGQKDGKLHFSRLLPGQPTSDLLPALFEDALKQMDELVPKRMRWSDRAETFVRPVQWLLCLLGSEVVPLSRFGCEAGRITYGHRFHAPDAIALSSPADYEAALKQAKVWARFDGRRNSIEHQVKEKASLLGGHARITPDLLDEVAALVEWPVVIAGDMEQRFMRLPPEVIVATVETNQRYFTVFADDALTQLLPCFITVSNIESKDVSQVISGNERVVRPRLSDAVFFWDQDCKTGLSPLISKLATTTYQKELGSLAAKVDRIDSIASKIMGRLPGDGRNPLLSGVVKTTVSLCKLDLFTKTVYEFPELQGRIGGYLAAEQRESTAVARAISEHYQPTQAGTPIPSTTEGRIVALADKFDTLAGFFSIGQKPTASKDPYALRRTALGVIRIVIEGGLSLDLRALALDALLNHPTARSKESAIADELMTFLVERLRGYCLDRGATVEAFEAARANGVDDLLDFEHRLQALVEFLPLSEASSLVAADKRARNILRQAAGEVMKLDPQYLELPAEKALHNELQQLSDTVSRLREARDYRGMLAQLATLKAPVDAFFVGVMVMDNRQPVRANRLALLQSLDGLCRQVADLSLLPG